VTQHLDHQRLVYLNAVIEHGGVLKAARHLSVAASTISQQLRVLQRESGLELFQRDGRKLRPTPAAEALARTLSSWTQLQREALERARGVVAGTLRVGVVESLPKTLARLFLTPVLELQPRTLLEVREDRIEHLSEALAAQQLDCVLSDTPGPQGLSARLHHRLLAEGGVALYAAGELWDRVRSGLPRHLDGAPFLLPPERTPLRRSLEEWLARNNVSVDVVGSFEDPALMKAFGCEGRGVFAAPMAIADELRAAGAERILQLPHVVERTWGIVRRDARPHPASEALFAAKVGSSFPPLGDHLGSGPARPM
jgi:LysR family transcriptional activator of nhaA